MHRQDLLNGAIKADDHAPLSTGASAMRCIYAAQCPPLADRHNPGFPAGAVSLGGTQHDIDINTLQGDPGTDHRAIHKGITHPLCCPDFIAEPLASASTAPKVHLIADAPTPTP